MVESTFLPPRQVFDLADELDEGLERAKRWRNVYLFQYCTDYGNGVYSTENEADHARCAFLEQWREYYAWCFTRVNDTAMRTFEGINDLDRIKIMASAKYGRNNIAFRDEFLCGFAMPVADDL